MHMGAPPTNESLLRKWKQKTKSVGIGIGIGVAVAIGLDSPPKPIAIATAPPIPIPIPMIAFVGEHRLFICRRASPGAWATVPNLATDFRPPRDFAGAVQRRVSIMRPRWRTVASQVGYDQNASPGGSSGTSDEMLLVPRLRSSIRLSGSLRFRTKDKRSRRFWPELVFAE